MAGTKSDHRLQLQNAESSVLFLQKQHAKTLEGLYAEISKLQKKCGELTFQLAMNSTYIVPDEEKIQERTLKAEKELDKKVQECTGLAKLLESRTKHIEILETRFKQMQEDFDESTSIKDKQVAMLTSELDAKASNIAYLTKQLYDSKVAYAELNKRVSRMNPDIMDTPSISPAPPVERAPANNRRRYVRKVVASNGNVDIESLGGILNVKTAKTSESFPARSVRTKTPTGSRSLGEPPIYQSRTSPSDYREFLQTGAKPDPKLVYKPVPNPLPPIMNEDNGAQVPYKAHRSRGLDPALVDEIIVSPLNSPDKSWRQGSNHYDPVS